MAAMAAAAVLANGAGFHSIQPTVIFMVFTKDEKQRIERIAVAKEPKPKTVIVYSPKSERLLWAQNK